MSDAQRWRSGGVQVSKKLYRATSENEFTEDLTDLCIGASVEWNADRGAGVKMTGEFLLRDRTVIDPHNDWLAPVLTLSWDDGVVEEQQFGLFLADWPEDEIRKNYGRSEVKGLDPTWKLWNSILRDTENAEISDNHIEFVEGVVEAAGITRHSFPASSVVFDAARSWFPPERRYTVAANVLEGMGWYHPFADLTGFVRSRPYVDLASAEPAVTITQDDPVRPVKVVRTATTLANIIVVRNPGIADGAGILSIAENADPFHPLSTANREPIVREINAPDVQTQAEADAIALEALRDAKSYYRVVSIVLMPGVWVRPYQVVDLYFHSDIWGCLCGRYHVREWKVGFDPEDRLEIECNRIVEFVHE